jgi:hypothetical protein
MMDFLRRLAPPRETDPARALAVLPPRFASETPLRVTFGQPQPAQRIDEDEASLSPEATSAAAATSTLATPRHPIADVRLSQAAPLPLGSELPRRDNGKVTSPTHAPAETPDVDVAEPLPLQGRQSVYSERARRTNPELQGLPAALPASRILQGVDAPPTQPRPALPLSRAILTQRTLQSQDDNQVVHVTIGRIDVVTNAAPVPAARRSPTPRKATVPLADYLRGGNGGRR